MFNTLDLYLHHGKLNSSFFARLARTYVTFLAISFAILASTIIYIDITQYISNQNDIYETSIDPLGEIVDSTPYKINVKIKKNDTAEKIIKSQSLPLAESKNIINLLNQINFNKLIKVGKEITFDYDSNIINDDSDDLANEQLTLRQITYQVSPTKIIEIIRDSTQNFVIRNQNIPLVKSFVKYNTLISNSGVINSMKKLAITTNNIIELVNIYSHQVDFERQIRNGDKLQIVVEKYSNDKGEFSHHGKIIYASMDLSGKKYDVYRYSPSNDEKYQYFSENAESITNNLLRTPLKLIRISSHFGKRHHPISGYTKMHTGVDFAAPKGTPIYSAGDGKIIEMCWKGGYGKYIKVMHNNKLHTAYAHANSFAKNLKKGSSVKQGQIIGYVGTTGVSTNPHLHYEVLVNNNHVNPLSVKIIPKLQLKGSKLIKFEQHKKNIQQMLKSI